MRHFLRFGARRTIARAALEVARRTAGVCVVDCLRLDAADLAPLNVPAGFEARWLTRDEVLAHAADPALLLRWSFREMALDRGDACLGLFDGARLASFSWYAVEPTPILSDRLLRFPRDLVYTYHGLTRPEYRGRRLYAAGRALALEHYAARGYRGLVTCIERGNYASRQSSRAMGFATCGTLYRFTLAGRTAAWANAACARGGIALERCLEIAA